MKNAIITLLITMFNFIPLISLNSIENDEHQFDMIDKSKEYNLRMYFFITYPSCSGCIENIDYIAKDLIKNKNIEIVGFISNTNNEIDSKYFEEKYSWNFNLFNDVMGLYYKYFEIEKSNSIVLFDNNGKKIKSFEFATDTKHQIDSIKNIFELSSKSRNYEVISDIIIKENNNEYNGDNYYLNHYSSKTKCFYLQGVTNCKLLITNITGEISDVIDFRKSFSFLYPTFVRMSWLVKDSLILLKCNDVVSDKNIQKSSDLTIIFDIVNKIYWKKDFPSLVPQKSCYNFVGNHLKNNILSLFDYFNLPFSDISKHSEPISLLDTNGNIIGNFGKLPEIYTKYNLNKVYGIFFDFDENFVYSYQSYSNLITKYDMDLNIKEDITINYSKIFKLPCKNYPKDFVFKDIIEFFNSISTFYDFKRNKLTGDFVFFQENRNAPVGTTDWNSPSIKFEDYFSIFDSKGNLIKEFLIPDRHVKIIQFNGDKIIYLVSIKNKIHLKTIKIER